MSAMPSYLEGFMWPLIDECRAKFHQSLDKIGATDFQRIRITKPTYHAMDTMEFALKSTPKLDLKATDLVLITTCARPKKKQDLFSPDVLYTLGVVERGNNSDDDESKQEVCVLVWAPPEARVTQSLQNQGPDDNRGWFVAVLDSLATPQRIWQALKSPLRNEFPVLNEAVLAGQEMASISRKIHAIVASPYFYAWYCLV